MFYYNSRVLLNACYKFSLKLTRICGKYTGRFKQKHFADAKRLIGRRFEDPSVQSDMKYWPFAIINDGGKPKIQLQYKVSAINDVNKWQRKILSYSDIRLMKKKKKYLPRVENRVGYTD